MSASDQPFDDLTEIDGIGPVRQEWLRKTLNVRTYADLAALSADDIEQKLKADGYVVSHAIIESWPFQAQKLVRPTTPLSKSSVEPVKGADPQDRNGGWIPYAAFMVEFLAHPIEDRQSEKRIAVHQVELDSMETVRSESWQDIRDEQIFLWMLGHAGEMPQTVEGNKEDSELPPSIEAPVKVEIDRVQIFQPPLIKFPDNGDMSLTKFPEYLKSSEPFNLGVSFSLMGSTAKYVANSGVQFRIRAYAVNVNTESSFDLGEVMTGSLSKGKVEYDAMLSANTLEPGVYQFWVTIAVQAEHTLPDFSKVPLISVV